MQHAFRPRQHALRLAIFALAASQAITTLDYLDVEQIEVLSGPQGTLYGKNTTAGALNPSVEPIRLNSWRRLNGCFWVFICFTSHSCSENHQGW
jgi:hypothetical protein